MGGVKIPLTPFLSKGAGHDPLREVLLLLRAADHNTLLESLLLFRAAIVSQYPKRGPYFSLGLQVTIPCERSSILLMAAGHNTLRSLVR